MKTIKSKSGTIVFLFAMLFQNAIAQEIKTGVDSFSYTVGINLGKGMKSQGLDSISAEALIKGIKDALKKDSGFAISSLNMEKVQRSFIQHEQAGKIKILQQRSEIWMAENAKKEGVFKLDSNGGQIKMIKSGTGLSPKYSDTIEYSVVVKTLSGKIIMDSRKREPNNRRHVLFHLGLTQLERAFMIAREGSEFEVYLLNEMVPEIGRNTDTFEDKYGITIFSVELYKVTPEKIVKKKGKRGKKTN